MSEAMTEGLAVLSAIMRISLGPAGRSIATSLLTCIFAAVTKMFPGPTILSTLGTVSVPYAIAAIACTPPIRYMSVAPAMSAATTRA